MIKSKGKKLLLQISVSPFFSVHTNCSTTEKENKNTPQIHVRMDLMGEGVMKAAISIFWFWYVYGSALVYGIFLSLSLSSVFHIQNL